MRTKRQPDAAVATLDPTLPAGCRPLTWGAWPSPDARLHISGVHGVWAFAGGVEYGRGRYVEVVPWRKRGPVSTLWTAEDEAHLTRYVARLERVFVLEMA